MMIEVIVSVFGGLFFGGMIAYFVTRSKYATLLAAKKAECESLQKRYNELHHELKNAMVEIQEKTIALTESQLRAELLQEKIEAHKEDFETMKKQLNLEFQNIATKILDENSTKFTQTSQEKLMTILKPLGDNIEKFKKKVEETYEKEAKERFSLGKEVEKLVEINKRISDEAHNLTNALKGSSKTQGDWGEMILENILEKSGLTKGREYVVQEFLKDENGENIKNEEGKKLQPDVIIFYPDNRKIIVDSKTSLTAYLRFVNAENDEERVTAVEEHVLSVRRHIDELSKKRYDDFAKSLDFVMMFIPNESAYVVAMQHDPNLWNYAYEKRIMLINPTNMITVLKLIADLWKREYQSKNAEEIARQGAKLYDKFVGFVKNLSDIGKKLGDAQESYNKAFGQLIHGKGNLVGHAEKLKQLGVKTKKSLPAELVEQSKDEWHSPDVITENHLLADSEEKKQCNGIV